MPPAPGGMGHVAFSVASLDEMMRMRDRIRDRGHIVLGPVDHGFCHSMYFSGPEGLALEICCNSRPEIDEQAWIDPECVARQDISPEELRRYMAPAAFKDGGGVVGQPAVAAQKYPPMFSGELLDKVMGMTEAELTQLMGGSEPPVASAPRETERA